MLFRSIYFVGIDGFAIVDNGSVAKLTAAGWATVVDSAPGTSVGPIYPILDVNNNVLGLDNGHGGTIGAITPFDTSAALTAAHNGVTLASISGSAVVATVNVNTIAQATMIQQDGVGSVAFSAGSGVTLNPASLVTTANGQIITLLPTRVANVYNQKLSA